MNGSELYAFSFIDILEKTNHNFGSFGYNILYKPISSNEGIYMSGGPMFM